MNLIRNYRNWRRYRETVAELSRLSNRELSDLGISRETLQSTLAVYMRDLEAFDRGMGTG